MSNESENKRIDLTQFEGKGIVPLMVLPNTYTIAQDNNRIYEDYNYPDDDENRYGWIVGNIDSHYESDDPEYGVVQSERQEVMAKLFAMAPDLIAELNRMYKREDELMEILSILEDRHDIDMSQFDAATSSLADRDYAQGNGELESTLGDGQPEWYSGM